jgi:pimeloyl-[acyl-carrier protein] methyl ester esterase
MKSYWLQKNNNEKVLLFFAGWGMDQNPFLKIRSCIYDVIIFYDYRNLFRFDITEIDRLLSNYNHADLLAWSMGVWSANFLLDGYKNMFENAVALNGTLLPVDDDYGIPKKIFQLTIDNFSEITRTSFDKRMCVDKCTLNNFESNTPFRTSEELKLELSELQVSIQNNNFEKNIFNKAIISDNDKIIPTENQVNFWKDRIEYHILEGPHFIFDRLKFWEEITGYVPKG